jgi:glycerate 2-kinase
MRDPDTLAAACAAAYRTAVARLDARALVTAALEAEPLPEGPVRVAALGKAAGAMLQAALGALGGRARQPLCALPEGTPAPAGVEVVRGAHPRPSAGSVEAGRALLRWAGEGGGLPALLLLSGGGSALAVAPAEGVAFDEKAEAVALLMRAGRPIGELNALRKHLSALKGGRLGLRLAGAPARVLVLSDVPGDDLSTIASGPCCPDPTGWDDVRRIVASSGVEPALPAAVRRLVATGGAPGGPPETPKPGDPRLAGVAHRILAGPVALARAAAQAARALGFEAEADEAPLTGDVTEVAARLGAWARAHAGRGPRLLALGGEPTVVVPPGAARPDGGRAQALALLAARALRGLPAAALAAGSDGRDGPTERAGAVVDGGTADLAVARGLDLDAALAAAASGPACDALGATLPRFETGTHVGDLVLVAVR